MLRPIFLTLFLLLSAASALAQEAPEQRMAALKAQLAPGKQIYIARQMALDPADEADFWPIYDAHQAELASLQQRRRENVAAYARAAAGGLDEDAARELAEDALEIAAEQAELMESTYTRLSRAIPPAKALKYLQLEMKLAALADYEAVAALP